MAVSLYAVAGLAQTATTTSVSVTVGTGRTGAQGISQGDSAVLFYSNGSANATAMIDSKGNTWTRKQNLTTGQSGSIWVLMKATSALVSGTDTITITKSSSGGKDCISVQGLAGAPNAIFDLAPAIAAGTSATPSVSTGALTVNSEAVFGCIIGPNATGSPTSPSIAQTDQQHVASNQFLTTYCEIVSAATSVTLSATIVSGNWTAMFVTIEITNNKAWAETGAGTDSFAGVPKVSLTESGTGSDAFAAVPKVVLAETGAGATGYSVKVAAFKTDSGSGSDSFSVHALATVADSGHAADAMSVKVAASTAETGHGAGSFTVRAAAALAEAGHGSGSFAVAVGVSAPDSGHAADSFAAGALTGASETGTGTDSFTVIRTAAPPEDTVTATIDSGGEITAVLSGGDIVTAVDITPREGSV